MNELHEFVPDVALRDAYRILADAQFIHAFQNWLNHKSRRTMWHIINSGDNTSPISLYNPFGFVCARMQPTLCEAPGKSVARGNMLVRSLISGYEKALCKNLQGRLMRLSSSELTDWVFPMQQNLPRRQPLPFTLLLA